MSVFNTYKRYSYRSAGVLFLVGVLAGVTVGGGVGVIAASSTKTVTVCADKKSNMLRYAKSGTCVKSETKVLLNQSGSDGKTGDTGDTGAKGDTGAAGAKGATGATGAKGDTGDTGAKGDTGAAGTSSPTGFTARSVCGSDGTTLCAVGVQGPGGGTIVYVDSTNEIAGYDYLEVAPTNASLPLFWSAITTTCGPDASALCDNSYLSDAGTSLGYIALGTGRAATAAIVARFEAGGMAKTSYAAGAADIYATATASDWFLPSKDELNEVCKYARNTGQAAGPSIVCAGGTIRNGFIEDLFWSSSEHHGSGAFAWYQTFVTGRQGPYMKDLSASVRPVRAF